MRTLCPQPCCGASPQTVCFLLHFWKQARCRQCGRLGRQCWLWRGSGAGTAASALSSAVERCPVLLRMVTRQTLYSNWTPHEAAGVTEAPSVEELQLEEWRR